MQHDSVNSETDALGHTVSYSNDGNADRIGQMRTRSTEAGVQMFVIRYVYDSQDRLVRTFNPDGSMNETEYNEIGKQAVNTLRGEPGLYMYTRGFGWVDNMHLMFFAGRAYKRRTEEGMTRDDAFNSTLTEGFRQELFDFVQGHTHSAFSYEDLPSDFLGALFGAYVFDPESSLTLAEQYRNFISQYEPVNPKDAHNFLELAAYDGNTFTNPTPFRNWTFVPALAVDVRKHVSEGDIKQKILILTMRMMFGGGLP